MGNVTPYDPSEALDRVRDLHRGKIGTYTDNDGCRWSGEYCAHCRAEWPCATIEAITP